MSNEILAATVGGAIGLAGACVPILWGIRYNAYLKATAEREHYLYWLRGLIPECEHIVQCIDELFPLYDLMARGGQVVCPTKQFNSDFLGAARIEMLKHPRSPIVFPQLTAAYRNVIHTNEMMGRFEKHFAEALLSRSQPSGVDLHGLSATVLGCLTQTRTTLLEVVALCNEQQHLVGEDIPKLFSITEF